MEKTINFLQRARKLILEKDLDWLNVIVGNEGVGKSTLGWHVCKNFDPNFSVDKVVFSIDEFAERVKNSTPGDAIMVDEGALIFFSRDSMSKDTKRAVRILTAMRAYNLFVTINVPNYWILDKYIREHRVKSVMRVVMRGWHWYFGPMKVKMIKRDKDKKYETEWPDWDFRDSFPKMSREEWLAYNKKKKETMLESKDGVAKSRERGGVNTRCKKCGYEWFYSGKREIANCPNCFRRTPTRNI